MSIYSGFPTRKDESKYNDLLSKLILLLQQHLLQTIEGALTPKKILAYTKVITKMRDYEEHKYLPPKFTELLDPLCRIIGITSSMDKTEPLPIQLDDRSRFATQKTKIFAQSATKTRTRSKLALCIEQIDSNLAKKSSLLQQQRLEPAPKKTLFQSTTELKELKHNLNIQTGQGRVQVGDTYEQQISKAHHKQISGSHPLILTNKMKNNLRYRAFQALTDAQENIHKRHIPLREQMRRKLKTSQQCSKEEL